MYIKGKVKFTLEQAMKVPMGSRGIAVLYFLTLVIDGDKWSTPRLGHITSGKETCYLLYRRLGGPQSWSAWVREISPPLGFDPRAIQPVVSCYTNSALLAQLLICTKTELCVCLRACAYINHLELELSAQYTVQKTWDLNGCPLLRVLSANNFSGHSVFSLSLCMSTVVDFLCQWVEEMCST